MLDYKIIVRRLGRRGAIALATVAAIIIGSIIFSSLFTKKQQAAGQQPPPAVPVAVAQVTLETVPLQITAIGRAEAASTVSITPQTEGQITRVNFTEGQLRLRSGSRIRVAEQAGQDNP